MAPTTLGLVGALALVAGACAGNDDDANRGNSGTQAGGGSGGSGGGSGGTTGGSDGGVNSAQPLTQEQLALVLLDANCTEVSDGGLGLARAQNAQVLDFAPSSTPRTCAGRCRRIRW